MAKARKVVQGIQKELEEEQTRRFGLLIQECEGHMGDDMAYKALRHIRQLAEAEATREIQAVRGQGGEMRNDQATVLRVVEESFHRQHAGQGTTLGADKPRMIRELPKVFTRTQAREIMGREVTMQEMRGIVGRWKKGKQPWIDQLAADAYAALPAGTLGALAERVTRVLSTGKAMEEWGGKVRPLYEKVDPLCPGNLRPI